MSGGRSQITVEYATPAPGELRTKRPSGLMRSGRCTARIAQRAWSRTTAVQESLRILSPTTLNYRPDCIVRIQHSGGNLPADVADPIWALDDVRQRDRLKRQPQRQTIVTSTHVVIIHPYGLGPGAPGDCLRSVYGDAEMTPKWSAIAAHSTDRTRHR
jgi:hypothetical protein